MDNKTLRLIIIGIIHGEIDDQKGFDRFDMQILEDCVHKADKIIMLLKEHNIIKEEEAENLKSRQI